MSTSSSHTYKKELAKKESARILVVSMRGFNSDASSCALYEFEDLIGDFEEADLFAPANTYDSLRKLYRFAKYVGRSERLAEKITPYPKEFVIDHEYDLLLVVVNVPWDLQSIGLIQGWRDKCKHVACYITEMFEPDLSNWRMLQEPFRNFDHVFVSSDYCYSRLSNIINRPVTHIPFGVDALKFCPYPNPPQRSIDVCSLGRRAPQVHEPLITKAQNSNLFYYYDTIKKQALKIDNYLEHRLKLINLLQRSRYSINYFAKFNEAATIGKSQEMGSRFFEGAAAGTIMLGMPPTSDIFSQYFDWEDIVIKVDPRDQDILAAIAELDAQPERLERIRRRNVVNSLLRHDWIYRWKKMLAAVNVEYSPMMIDREQRLQQLAKDIQAC
jgi:Glycosyl transferases group 1